MGLRKMFKLHLVNFCKAKIAGIGLTWLIIDRVQQYPRRVIGAVFPPLRLGKEVYPVL